MRPAISLTLTSFRGPAAAAAQAPAQIGTGDWSVADAPAAGAVDLTISALPADGGTPILDIEFQVDGGVWVPGGLNLPGNIAVSGLTDGQSYSFALRARNGAGNGVASGAKTWIVHDTTAPVIASVTLNQTSDSFDLTGVSEAGMFFGLIDSGATPMSGAAIEAAVLAATAPATVSFPVVSGANAVTIDKSGVAPGTAYFHATIKDGAGNYALDAPVAFTQPVGDTVAPVLSSSQPANGAGGVAVGAAIVLTFSEAVRFGAAGSVVLFNVSDGVVHETFDVATGSGDGAGAILVSGSDVTLAPGAALLAGKTYSIQSVTAGAVQDLAANAFAGWSSASTVVSFTTAAATATSFGFLGEASAPAWASSHTFNAANVAAVTKLPAVLPSGRIVVLVGVSEARTILGLTIDGVTATQRAAQTAQADQMYLFDAVIAGGGSGDIVVTLSGGTAGCFVAVWNAASASFLGVAAQSLNNQPAGTVYALDMATTAGQAVMAGRFSTQAASLSSWGGVAARVADRTVSLRRMAAADNLSVAGGAPEAFSWASTTGYTLGSVIAALYG
jgi:Bacterial Ig-like domain